MQSGKNIVMLAAENDSLINGKVGGLADVIRDLPNALADFGLSITIITPSYGFLHKDNPSKFLTKISFPFNGKNEEGEIWEVTAKQPGKNVKHLVLEHKNIRGNPIYSQDPPGQPYAQDATKFAIFCSAVGKYLQGYDPLTIIHLHDWHVGTLFLLKELHPEFQHLKKFKHVFTIHNLSYQGTRPMFGKYASVEQWFPELFHYSSWIEIWKDHRYKIPQFTPLIAAIKFSDKINTVSPSYSKEILEKSDHENCFYGGEGLEIYLQEAEKGNRLFGILNGIEYPERTLINRSTFQELCISIVQETKQLDDKNTKELFAMVTSRLESYKTAKPNFILTSVTRVTEQKVRLLFEEGSNSKTAIETINNILKQYNGFYILSGNGAQEYEDKCIKAFYQYERLIYLKLYSAKIAQLLYSSGDIFLMPSSFEPCGISQMIAMREGQPCIVHAVGGLKDTVIDGVNGFQFKGASIKEKVDNMVYALKKAINIFLNDKKLWEKIKSDALKARFEWKESAKKYIELLYE